MEITFLTRALSPFMNILPYLVDEDVLRWTETIVFLLGQLSVALHNFLGLLAVIDCCSSQMDLCCTVC